MKLSWFLKVGSGLLFTALVAVSNAQNIGKPKTVAQTEKELAKQAKKKDKEAKKAKKQAEKNYWSKQTKKARKSVKKNHRRQLKRMRTKR